MRYRNMNDEELYLMINQVKKELRKAEQLQRTNEVEVLKAKLDMVQSYRMDPNEFKFGDTYELRDEADVLFTVSYVNGVFAWGRRSDDIEQDRGIPFARLGTKIGSCTE